MLFYAAAALAFPASASPQDDLAKTQSAIKISEAKKARLVKEQAKLEAELNDLQEKLVRTARQIQQSEANLAEAESKLQSFQGDMVDKKSSLTRQRNQLDSLLRIAFRLSRTPPQAMILMPEKGLKHIQAAHALSLVVADIKQESSRLQQEMKPLHNLTARWKKQKATAEKLQKDYRSIKDSFEKSLQQRSKLRDSLMISQAQEEEKLAILAKKARSLEALVQSLNDVAKEADEQIKKQAGSRKSQQFPQNFTEKSRSNSGAVAGKRGLLRDLFAVKGRLRAPLSGQLVKRFGQREGSGEAHKGITISGRSGATVVAPFDAEVVYSGQFLNYGNMIILKHRGDYHTLLAGLARIDVKNGEFLLEGEPIGVIGEQPRDDLYVEIREHNVPVNPETWIKGL